MAKPRPALAVHLHTGEWLGIVFGLQISGDRHNGRRDLTITLDRRDDLRPAPLHDVDWLYDRTLHPLPADTAYTGRQYDAWPTLSRQASIVCDRVNDIAIHALEPALHHIGGSVVAIAAQRPDNPTAPDELAHRSSVFHALQRLIIAGPAMPDAVLADTYRRIIDNLAEGWLPWQDPEVRRVAVLTAACLNDDAAATTTADLRDWLTKLEPSLTQQDRQHLI